MRSVKITVKRVHAPGGRESFLEATPAGQETTEPSPVELPPGSTVAQLLDSIGISQADVGLVLVNGVERDLETPLHEGDAVAVVGRVAEM